MVKFISYLTLIIFMITGILAAGTSVLEVVSIETIAVVGVLVSILLIAFSYEEEERKHE